MAAPSFYGTPLFFDFMPWLALMAAVVGIFLLCWAPFIRSLTHAVARITRATGEIANGNFSERLDETRGDEVGRLSASINQMSERLAGFVTGQKRFLGAIAHELCAPIARMQFGLGILEQRAEEGQQQAVADVQEEVGHMSELINELLLFSKAGMEPASRPLDRVDVARAIQVAVEREAATVEIHAPEGLRALADETYLVRALSNLIRNAVRYAEGPITVEARTDAGDVAITISDNGPGLPPEELDRVFTPLFRIESSRNRAQGGAGLGLAIVKSCVEACRGRVSCRNRTPCGLEVEIRLPVVTL
jgi:two-component system sensor histidine kinase CpxA